MNYKITVRREKLVYEEIEVEINLKEWANEHGLELDEADGDDIKEMAYEYATQELDIWNLGGYWEETGEEEVNKEFDLEIVSVIELD